MNTKIEKTEIYYMIEGNYTRFKNMKDLRKWLKQEIKEMKKVGCSYSSMEKYLVARVKKCYYKEEFIKEIIS